MSNALASAPNSGDTPLQDATEIFGAEHATKLLLNIRTSRAILRALVFACAAQEDGSMVFEDYNGADRWGNIFSEVASRLRVACDIVGKTARSPRVETYTALRLAEVMDAAQWHTMSDADLDGLEPFEVAMVAQAIVGVLDGMLSQCAAEGVTGSDDTKSITH